MKQPAAPNKTSKLGAVRVNALLSKPPTPIINGSLDTFFQKP
jgi:hypothetical protein